MWFAIPFGVFFALIIVLPAVIGIRERGWHAPNDDNPTPSGRWYEHGGLWYERPSMARWKEWALIAAFLAVIVVGWATGFGYMDGALWTR